MDRRESLVYDYETHKIISKANRKLNQGNTVLQTKIRLIDKIFPGVDILSWGSSAIRLWYWMAYGRMEDVQKVGLMPTLVVDHKDRPGHRNGTTGERSVIQGENIWNFRAFGHQGMNPDVSNLTPEISCLMSTHSEIRVYQKNYDSLIKEWWNGRAPLEVHQMIMAHTLIHEMMHYATMSKLWLAQFDGQMDSNEAFRRYADHFYNHLCTVDDELENEAKTMTILYHLAIQGFGDVVETMEPTIGGRYDLWRRERDPAYCKIMDAFEMVQVLLGSYYTGMRDSDVENIIGRALNIAAKQEKAARDSHYRVVIID